MRAAVIMPCFGEHHMTDDIIDDLMNGSTSTDIWLMDNKHDYVPKRYYGRGTQLFYHKTPQLRWLKGTNFGTAAASQYQHYDLFVWLNNDTRVSYGFIEGLLEGARSWDGERWPGIIAPVYDDVWPQQHSNHHTGDADFFVPHAEERVVKFVDGACMAVTADAWNMLGPMDEARFGQFGWGGDIDYCIRARQAGMEVLVTERAYFNHLGGGTNKLLEENYKGDAGAEMNAGLNDKYGPNWGELL